MNESLVSTGGRPSAEVDDLAGLDRAERLAVLRRRMAAIPAKGEQSDPEDVTRGCRARVLARGDGTPGRRALSDPGVPASPGLSAVASVLREPVERGTREPIPREVREASTLPGPSVLPVPAPLADLLPHGGLARGTVAAMDGASSMLLGVVAAVTAAGGQVAVVGHRRLGLVAAAEMGADLSRVALVPDPGSDAVEVAAVLLDGMDLVVLGLGGMSVPPSRSRAVVARARAKGAALVVTDGRWDGAHVRIDSRVCGYDGPVGAGDRLRRTTLAVRAHGRAFAPRTGRMEIRAEAGRVEWRPDEMVATYPAPSSTDLAQVAR